MRLSIFADSENRKKVLKSQLSFWVFTVAVLVTGIFFVWSIYQSYQTTRLQMLLQEEATKIANLHVSGENFNESSKAAVKMSAVTGETSWEKAYHEGAPRFLELTKNAESFATDSEKQLLLNRIIETQKKAEETENKIFTLLHRGKNEEAKLLASSDNYESQKRDFSEALSKFLQEIDNYRDARSEKVGQNALWFLAAEIILLAFFIWAWLAVVDNLRRVRRILSAKTIENKRAAKIISQSEEKFRSIVETTSEWIWSIDKENKITYSNPAAEKILGYCSEELLGKEFLSLICKEDRKKAESDFGNFISRKQPWNNLTYRWQHANGSICYLENSGTPVFDRNGDLTGYRGVGHNLTKRKLAEDDLQKNLALLSSVFESANHGILIVDSNNGIVNYNKHFVQMWQIPDELIATSDNKKTVEFASKQLINADDFVRTTDTLNKNPELKNHDLLFFKDGRVCERYSQPYVINGKVAGRVLRFRDITEQQKAQKALAESEYKLRTLLENMNEGISQVDRNQIIEFVNDRFCEMTGYEREQLLGKSVFDIFPDEEDRSAIEEANEKRLKGISNQYEVRLRKKSGEILWVIIGGAPVVNAANEVVGSIGVFIDITERKRAEEKLIYDALHDGLTGLANRTLFIDHLQKTVERGRRNENISYAVLFLDFDRFKVINDSLGHAEGDNLLKQIARRLENLLRGGDLLARLSGDEFTILLNDLSDREDAITIAKRIRDSLNLPFTLGGQEIFMSASIGIAGSNAGYTRAEDMLRDADIAMYRAKAKGKAQHQVFDETMHAYALNRFQLENELHHALQRGEFSLSYQPIVDIGTNNLSGFEALIRWNHPERGLISPGDFIPAAEENGVVIPLGRWILYESCRQMREWQRQFAWASDLTVSVNLSCKQFLQSDLCEQVTAALISTGLDPCCLKLEITESHVMESSEKAATMMNKLRSIGVGISLDDFGTGYSSLSYLHRLPLDYLKIDRSFVSRMIESRENREIVYTIVKLAQNLRMKVVAEGIENKEQLEQLKNVGCEYGQGYFISKPLDAETATVYLDKIRDEQFISLDVPIINAELNM